MQEGFAEEPEFKREHVQRQERSQFALKAVGIVPGGQPKFERGIDNRGHLVRSYTRAA
jgi:hypothetical protein